MVVVKSLALLMRGIVCKLESEFSKQMSFVLQQGSWMGSKANRVEKFEVFIGYFLWTGHLACSLILTL
jgi:hypothetical protein